MRANLVLFCLLSLAPWMAHAASPADFSGDWIASDDQDDATPATPAKQAPDNGSSPHSGRGMGGGHHGGRGNHAQNNNGDASSGAADAGLVPRDHAHALLIRQSDDVFDIEANGRRMAYRFDNRHNYGPQYGGTVTLTWSQPEMVIETRPDGGGDIEEHYSLSTDGKKLTLMLREQRSDGSDVKQTRRVYVRRETEATAAP